MSGEQGSMRVVLDREYEGASSTLRTARNDVVGCLKTHVADPDIQERAELVVSELATNAIQASPGSAYRVRVSLDDDGAVVMAVTSATARDTPPPRDAWGPANAIAPKGRGLLIVGQLTDDVGIEQPRTGTIVVTATLRSAQGAST
jgi:anti-sigma regulatory factor (Ser/Thr protein kinase)